MAKLNHQALAYASNEQAPQYAGEYSSTDRVRRRQAFLVAKQRRAEALDAAIESRGWSNRQVARWVGVTFQFVQMMRKGLRTIPSAILEELERRGLKLEKEPT